MSRLRVGIVSYLNAWPLAWGLLQGHDADRFEAMSFPPARVADMLRNGEIDIGLIPSIEVQRIPGLRVLPDLCVAATHEVRSVLLVLAKPIAEVRRVALDLNSRTSAGLVRVLMADRYGLRPEYVQAPPDPDAMLADADAALVIGDPALRVDRERWQILDLAAEWRALTGHPFVFAVWAVREGVRMPELPFAFRSSLQFGLSSMDDLVRTASTELGLPGDEVRTYLTHYLSYTFREPEIAGLSEYYRRAAAHGLIPAAQPLDLWAA